VPDRRAIDSKNSEFPLHHDVSYAIHAGVPGRLLVEIKYLKARRPTVRTRLEMSDRHGEDER
jgi:hypothetical protein